MLGGREFGSIRIGVSMLLVQEGLRRALVQAAWTALVALLVASVVATVLAGWMLRPIHVISSGLTRLGRGEFDVRLDLPPGDEFRALGSSFAEVNARLAAAAREGPPPDRQAADASAAGYARKQAALGRLLAGVAHEVKNPLNAMTIHLELLKQKLQDGSADAGLLRHVTIISGEIARLDQAMAGLVKFVRPEELRLQPVQVGDLIADVVRMIEPEARVRAVAIRTDCARDLPDINADAGMLQQALVNLALNACQAMPSGGTLEFRSRAAAGRRVEVAVSDTGVGIAPDHLQRIFDLYFTTREGGSGIGLSLVYRTVQLHDGEIAVESTPGRGTTFRMLLPQT
jgi:signal transduction histidine kinase